MVLNYYETRSGVNREPTKQKDVIFIDYDGTEIFSCSEDELEHIRMPDNPSHSGLIAQGWNWTLPQIKEQLKECHGSPVYVGQLYITESGATEVDIVLTDERKKPTICFKNSIETTTIDWGDGNIESYSASNTTRAISHEYASGGSYTIKIFAPAGLEFNGNNVSGFIRDTGASSDPNDLYAVTVQNIRIGDCLNFNYRSLYNFYSLKTITMSKNATASNAQVIVSGYSLQSITFNPNCSFSLENSYSLKNISLPYGLTSIVHGNMFTNCRSLEHITIPITVTSIDSTGNMFGSCYSLKKIVLPKSITDFTQLVFSNCSSLKSVVLLGDAPINGAIKCASCYMLENITVPGGISDLLDNSFDACDLIESVVLHDGIAEIKKYAFRNCRRLVDINIPSSVVNIQSYAFTTCEILNAIELNEGLESIGEQTFLGCYALESLTIPSTVTSIGYQAFLNCPNIVEYHILPTIPPTLGGEAFKYIQDTCTIYVPRGYLTAYQTATNWSEWASYMQEEPA